MAKRELKAHIHDREEHDHYVDELWPTARLFDEEEFFGPRVGDPACGWGRILLSARKHGFEVRGSDIVDRRGGDPFNDIPLDDSEFLNADFLSLHPDSVMHWWGDCDSIVSNPPFDQFEAFAARCCALIRDGAMRTNKVALLWLVRRLPAAHWLQELPLSKVLYITPRPSMPTGDFIHRVARGELGDDGRPLKISGATQDACWLVFSSSHKGPPTVGWLHRDGRVPT